MNEDERILRSCHEAGKRGVSFEEWHYNHLLESPNPETVIKEIMGVESIRGTRRVRETYARHIVIWYTMRFKGKSSTLSGAAFGKDHSTAINSRDRVNFAIETKDKTFFPIIKKFTERMGVAI